MLNEDVVTAFAPAAREDKEVVLRQNNLVANIPMLHRLVDLMTDAFLLLNGQRQIVFGNKAFFKLLNDDNAERVYGLRPGEALHCIYSKTPGGCGTSEHCVYCGAVNSILHSQSDPHKVASANCNIVCEGNVAVNLQVWAQNLLIKRENYTIFVIRDISDKKRRRALEHTFFRDIFETIDSLQSIVSLLSVADKHELDSMIGIVKSVADALIEEIKDQKDILYAESGELKVNKCIVNSGDIVKAVYNKYVKYDSDMAEKIAIDRDTVSVDLCSDRKLIMKVLNAMLDNALEAVYSGYPVTIGAKMVDGSVEFWVHNQEVMSQAVKMQIFKRYFSSKGEGRGLGTYSMKLLGENYLGGKVSFVSETGFGTVFSLVLPLSDAS